VKGDAYEDKDGRRKKRKERRGIPRHGSELMFHG
jgi:hypothetical protein